MRSTVLTLPAVLSGALLLTACGPQQAGSEFAGPTQVSSSPPRTFSCGAAPSTDYKITAATDECTEFELTNHKAEAFTYAISFTFRSASGQAMATAKQRVPSVQPGQTVKSRVATHAAGREASARITEVRSVPSGEAPSDQGPCPPSGVRVYADEEANAAMGLRALGLNLENCGTGTTELNGYPQLQILDEDHKAVDSVKVLKGGSAIATGTGADGQPEPLTLKPGERAQAGLVWRNTTQDGAPVNAPYLRVWAKPGADPVMVIPELDLGTTGQLGVGPWTKAETGARVTG